LLKISHRQSGFSMIEVLVTLIILLVGLLGLAGLMVQSQRSEMESYQRVQAMVLLQDMVARISANRLAAVTCYGFTTSSSTGTPYLGTGATFSPTCSSTAIMNDYTNEINFALPPATYQSINNQYLAAASAVAPASAQTAISDLNAWNTALQGAAETMGGNVGAMVGARGCISYDGTNLLNSMSGQPIPGSGLFTLSVAWQGMGDTYANTSLLCGSGLYGAETKRRVIGLSFRVGSIANTQ
jgi:type IV pilus assembly protein PilV